MKNVSVLSCAPAPLWDAIPNLTSLYPDKNISSQLTNSEKIIEEYENGNVNYAFLPYSYKNFVPCLTEQLFLAVKKEHEFSELVKTSSLPCFATDIEVAHRFSYEDRILIPIKDAEATVTFYTNSRL